MIPLQKLKSPPPEYKSQGGPEVIYPFASMEVMDTFTIPHVDAPSLASMRVYCSKMGRRYNAKFRAVRLNNNDIQVFRAK